jgi:hypothetical protein
VKKLLISLLALGSLSSFAEESCFADISIGYDGANMSIVNVKLIEDSRDSEYMLEELDISCQEAIIDISKNPQKLVTIINDDTETPIVYEFSNLKSGSLSPIESMRLFKVILKKDSGVRFAVIKKDGGQLIRLTSKKYPSLDLNLLR